MGFGRFLCVALPLILTISSFICLLITALGCVLNTDLYIFRINVTTLSIDIGDLTARPVDADLGTGLIAVRNFNVTAADLGLTDLYDVSLWGYCTTNQDDQRVCTNAKFDWASSTLDTATQKLGQQIQLPTAVADALEIFATLINWSEIAFASALICLVVELFFGIFTNCSRVWSCVTFIVAGITSVVVLGAASLATATTFIVIGAIETTAKWFGVTSSLNVCFLALIWLSATLALAAGAFWLFTVCCCAPSYYRNHRSRNFKAQDAEGRPTGNYAAPHYPNNAPHPDITYEPYSYRA